MPLGGATLGASGAVAPMPSPAEGTGGANQFMQLASAAAQVPAMEAEAKKKKAEVTILQSQAQQAKAQAAQTRISTMTSMLKGNPNLAQSQPFVEAIRSAYKDLGGNVPAPIVEGGSPNPAPSAGTAGGPGAPPGSPSQPAQDPMAQRQAAMGPNAPQVDVAALFPHPTLTDILDKNPEFYKVITASQPAQRPPLLAQFGITPGSPGYDAIVNMPTSKPPQEYAADMTMYRSMLTSFGKGDMSPSTMRAALASIAPRLQQDGIDPASLITPEMTQQMGAAEQAKINAMSKAGIIGKEKADAMMKRAEAEIQNIGSLASLRSAQANLASTRASLLPEDVQSRIQARLAASDHAAQNISLRMQEFQLHKEGSNVAKFNKSRADLVGEASNLRSQISTLQGVGKTLLANNPNAIDPSTGQTYMSAISAKINQLQPALDQATNAIQQANHGKEAVVQRAIGDAVGAGGAKALPSAGTTQVPDLAPMGGKVLAGHMPNGRAVYKQGGAYIYDDGTPAR